jgi:hypothetical protein
VTAAKIDWATTGANGGIWWEELGRTRLTVAGDNLQVSSIPSRRHLKVRVSILNSGAIDMGMRFNGDTGLNYAFRLSSNGAAEVTATGSGFIRVEQGSYNILAEYDILNIANQEKLLFGQLNGANTVGAGNLPARMEISAKWANTAAAINTVLIYNVGAGDMAVGSEIIVLGHD